MKTRAEIIVEGKVQEAGYRSFIKGTAESLSIVGYADNLPDKTVKIVCEGEQKNIEKFVEEIKNKSPSFARVDNVKPRYDDYKGEFTSFERIGDDVLEKEATLNDVVKAMNKFNDKGEVMIKILGDMNGRLGSIDNRLDSIDGKQDSMLEKQEQTINEIKAHRIETENMHSDLADRSDKLLISLADRSDKLNDNVTGLFTALRGDYGVIYQTMIKMFEEMQKERKASDKRTEKLVKAILKSKSAAK